MLGERPSCSGNEEVIVVIDQRRSDGAARAGSAADDGDASDDRIEILVGELRFLLLLLRDLLGVLFLLVLAAHALAEELACPDPNETSSDSVHCHPVPVTPMR